MQETQQTSFYVRTTNFEGPLDLLLTLIEKRKMLVNDVSLAEVADDYLAYVKELERFPVSDSAQFLLVASTLVLIKSKSLLPTLELTQEEQGDAERLEERLQVYSKMRHLVDTVVRRRFGKRVLFARSTTKDIPVVFSPDTQTDTENIKSAMYRVLQRLPKVEYVPETIVQKVVSLEEMIENLTERIQKNIKMSFSDFSGSAKQRVDVVVSFIAMLELVKQGIIDVNQDNQFGAIHMESRNVGVPQYND